MKLFDTILSALLCWLALPIIFAIALARGLWRATGGVIAETALAWAGFIDREEEQLRNAHE